MHTALQWLYDNLYNYMIPICGLCVLRVVVSFLLFAVVAAGLAVVGYRIGKRKGEEADRIWQEVVNELAASEEGEKVNALSIESNIHGLIDTLDVFDQETTSSDDAGDAQ